MKRTKRLLAILLCLTMTAALSAGCGKKNTNAEFDPEAVVMTVGGEQVPLKEAYFMLKWQQASYQTMASNFYGEEWYNQDLEGNGETFLDYIKSTVMETLEDMYLCRQNAEANNVTLTEEEQQKISDTAKTFMNANSKDAQDAMMASEETVRRVLENYTYYNKVYNEIVKDADTSVSEEEARQRTYSYIYQDLVSTDADGNQTEMTDAEKQQYYTKFAEIANAAKDSGDFDKAAEDGGYQVSQHPYTAADYEDDSFKDINGVADDMKVGDVSDLIPVDGGLFLIHLDSDNDEERTEAMRESMASQKQSEYFENWLSPIRDAAKTEIDEDLWGEIGFEKALASVVEEE